MIKRLIVGVTGVLLIGVPARAQDEKPVANLKDYLVDSSGGYVGAAGIIGVDDKLVRDVASPKEFVATVRTANSKDSKDGFGVAFSPGRSRFEMAAINLASGNFNDDAQSTVRHRLWGSTTISYAQNRATYGPTEYKQRALAANVEYFLNVADDPSVATYRSFKSLKECALARDVAGDGNLARLAEALKEARQQAAVSRISAALASPTNDTPPAAAAAASSAAAGHKAKADQSDAVTASITQCTDAMKAAAKAKWNAPKATLLYGRADLQGLGASDPKLSLGRHLQISLSASPEFVMDGFKSGGSKSSSNQFTLSYNKVLKALDTSSLEGTPVYKTRSQTAVRYTRSWSAARESYLLAEASTAKANEGASASGAYRYAVGWDYKLGANMWLEFRSGRSVARAGDKLEQKSLISFKFSPDSGLASLFGGP